MSPNILVPLDCQINFGKLDLGDAALQEPTAWAACVQYSCLFVGLSRRPVWPCSPTANMKRPATPHFPPPPSQLLANYEDIMGVDVTADILTLTQTIHTLVGQGSKSISASTYYIALTSHGGKNRQDPTLDLVVGIQDPFRPKH
ncbi:hypothetical protein CC2G_014983 [Coprinopsis cinerea AmutBmut pab1-1]|nr:hypothetical protein CC2G_014983 [Coprinopsis cinerea AmutBmut pab1-1]